MKKVIVAFFCFVICALLTSCYTEVSNTGESEDVVFDMGTNLGEEEKATAPIRARFKSDVHAPYLIYENDLIRPNAALTRAETAYLLYQILDNPAAGKDGFYVDIPEDAWYRPFAESMGSMGVLEIFGTRFEGDRLVTRSEFTVLISRFFAPQDTEIRYSDVPEDHWAFSEISTGIALGWFSCGEENNFRPQDNITRAEAATLVNRATGRQPSPESAADTGFPFLIDLQPSHWAYYDLMEAALYHEYELEGEYELWLNFQCPSAQRTPGFYNVSGELYCVDEGGEYIRDASVGVLDFNSNGQYTTGNIELDEQLTTLVNQKTIERWGQKINFRILYLYVCDNFRYWPTEMVEEGSDAWEAEFALDLLTTGKGNCYNYAGLVTMLARKLGYQARGISGQFYNDFQDWTVHGWSEIELDGELFVCDAEIEGEYAPNRGLEWDLFFKPYNDTPLTYTINGEIL